MNKRICLQWTAAWAFALLTGVGAHATDTPTTLSGVKVVSAEEAKKLQDSGVPLIDTRMAAEFAEKTIKGARNVAYKDKGLKEPGFDASKDEFDLGKLPGDKATAMVFFCNSSGCWLSYKAAIAAQKAGYSKIHWLRGGLSDWVAKGLPTQ